MKLRTINKRRNRTVCVLAVGNMDDGCVSAVYPRMTSLQVFTLLLSFSRFSTKQMEQQTIMTQRD